LAIETWQLRKYLPSVRFCDILGLIYNLVGGRAKPFCLLSPITFIKGLVPSKGKDAALDCDPTDVGFAVIVSKIEGLFS
jgi:hypothetical protein